MSERAKRSQLPLALGIAIAAALVLTVVSIITYYRAGFYVFDLSRPGFESERQDLSDEDVIKTYDTTSPVTKEALDIFLSEYDARVEGQKAYGNFKDNALSDEELILKERAQ